MKIDFLTPTMRGFEARNSEYLCHWLVDSGPQVLSAARKSLIKRADTDLVLFVDDDIEFGSEHVKMLLDRMGPGIGAVESNPQIPGFPVQRSERVTRGWTGFTLLRCEAARGWNPPALTRFEDEDLRREVLGNGFKWVRALECVVVHHAESRGVPGPLTLHWEDGYNAWKVLPVRAKAWMILKTPVFVRHGKLRFEAHLSFLGGMFNCMIDDLVARMLGSL